MDIVERLRQEIGGYTDKDIERAEVNMQEAADEIQRLRQKHKDMVSKLKWVVNEYNKLLNDHNELLKETTGGE
jgi:uncharacterized protein YdcH (DUF465 family)